MSIDLRPDRRTLMAGGAAGMAFAGFSRSAQALPAHNPTQQLKRRLLLTAIDAATWRLRGLASAEPGAQEAGGAPG